MEKKIKLCEYAYYEPNETFLPQLLCHKFDKQDNKQRWAHLCLNQYRCDADMCWKNTKGSVNCEVKKCSNN